jgi:hypothetical protein
MKILLPSNETFYWRLMLHYATLYAMLAAPGKKVIYEYGADRSKDRSGQEERSFARRQQFVIQLGLRGDLSACGAVSQHLSINFQST